MATVVKHGAEPTRQRTLLAQMVDQIASTNPSAVYGMWPVVPTSYEAGFRPITYAQLANIVNGLAWWLAEKQRGQPKGSEVFAYVGPNDARVPALALAGVKTGYPVSKDR
jgi:acyl-coenzyme A synthetase/AMP-(fatty) acid ligase